MMSIKFSNIIVLTIKSTYGPEGRAILGLYWCELTWCENSMEPIFVFYIPDL